MIIPCIDLQGGKVVQLVQGERTAVELESPDDALRMFAGFPLLHVIDLDAAKGEGDNLEIVRYLTSRVRARVGGGVRTLARARELLDAGAEQVIVGTRAFTSNGVDAVFLDSLRGEVGAERVVVAIDVKHGRVAIKGWREQLSISPGELLADLEPYCGGFLCTYVDKEGMLEGTDLELFLGLREKTGKTLTAAGGITTMDEVRALVWADIEVALGMAVYTGRLDLQELRALNG